MLDTNGLLKPIQNKKIRSKISNEIKILFSNRTFVYNLIEPPNQNADLLQIAQYFYTNLKTSPSMDTIKSIDLTNLIIAKSFGTSLDKKEELDDVLIKDELVNSDWYRNPTNVKVKVDETELEYIHYKRIYTI